MSTTIPDTNSLIEHIQALESRIRSLELNKSSSIPLINIAGGGPNTDAFGRLRTSNPYTIFDSKQLHDDGDLFFDDQQTSGSGTTSTFSQNRASTTLAVNSAVAGTRIRQSKLRGVYQPGKSQEVLVTFVAKSCQIGVEKIIGYGDEKNGIFVVIKNDGIYLRRRTYTSGSAVNEDIAQADWNVNKVDGTGNGGWVLDIEQAQIFILDFEWLGVGTVRAGFVIDGNIVYAHHFNHSNRIDKVYMSTPNLPIRYEITSAGTGTGSDALEAICSSIISEGGQEDTTKSTYISRDGTPITLANQDLYTPIISFRIQSGHEGVRPTFNTVNLMSTSNINYEWRLYLNPTIAGVDSASWVDTATSCLEYDISRTATNLITGGHILAGGYGSSGSQVKETIAQSSKGYLTLGTKIDGTSDQVVLAVANIDGNGGSMYGGVSFSETL
jgi:hypothetical protein